MFWRGWSYYQRWRAVHAAVVVFLLAGAAVTWAQGSRGPAAAFAAVALVSVAEGVRMARREQRKPDDNEPEPSDASAHGPVWVSNTRAAVSALAFSLFTPLTVAVGMGLALAGTSWGFIAGFATSLLLLRLSQGRVTAYAKATGARDTEWALVTPGYLRFFSVPLGWDWRVVAAVCWLAPAALAAGYGFLWLNYFLALAP